MAVVPRKWAFEVTPPPPRSESEELKWALGLFETGVWLTRERFKRENPGADEAEIERMIEEWLVPSAPAGDAPGVARRWLP